MSYQTHITTMQRMWRILSVNPYKYASDKYYNKQLKKLPTNIQDRIIKDIKEKLCVDPFGKSYPLSGPYKKQKIRSFRVGIYRSLIVIYEKDKCIQLLDLDKRDSIYNHY